MTNKFTKAMENFEDKCEQKDFVHVEAQVLRTAPSVDPEKALVKLIFQDMTTVDLSIPKSQLKYYGTGQSVFVGVIPILKV